MNVALLGYGYSGKTLHAPLIERVEGLRLNARRAPEEVFDDPSVDPLVIATPNHTHFDLARRALAAGKHVVVEKPFTTTLAEAVDLGRMARKTGRILSVFHNRRWDGDFLTVRQLIASGELGEVVHFESHYDRYRPTVVQRWREQAGAGGGIWFDLGAHLVDQALQLFGAPLAVYADLAIEREGALAVDYFHVLLRYARTRVVLHGSNLVAEFPVRFAVHGTTGSYVKYGMDAQEDALKRNERPGGAGWGIDPLDGTLTSWRSGMAETRKVPTIAGNYLRFYEGLRDAIRSGAPNPVPVDEAVAVMAVIQLACESAAEGRELPFPALTS